LTPNAVKAVVETPQQVEDPLLQITVDDARKIDASAEVGGELHIPKPTEGILGRIAAQLAKQVFNDKPFNFPPELYNHLASSRWEHWGADVPLQLRNPVEGLEHQAVGGALELPPLGLDLGEVAVDAERDGIRGMLLRRQRRARRRWQVVVGVDAAAARREVGQNPRPLAEPMLARRALSARRHSDVVIGHSGARDRSREWMASCIVAMKSEQIMLAAPTRRLTMAAPKKWTAGLRRGHAPTRASRVQFKVHLWFCAQR
jgi:hypothetical protein